jgi:hypothetical protein
LRGAFDQYDSKNNGTSGCSQKCRWLLRINRLF